jgi:hypothetical protein
LILLVAYTKANRVLKSFKNVPDEVEDNHKEIEEGNGHDDKVYGRGADLLVLLAAYTKANRVLKI